LCWFGVAVPMQKLHGSSRAALPGRPYWNPRPVAAYVAPQVDRFTVSRTADDFGPMTAALGADRRRRLGQRHRSTIVNHNVIWNTKAWANLRIAIKHL